MACKILEEAEDKEVEVEVKAVVAKFSSWPTASFLSMLLLTTLTDFAIIRSPDLQRF